MCKNVPSDFAFPKHLLFICRNRANKTNTALSISIIPLIKAIFGLSGLEFCQKLQICMPNLVMLITHFGQKFKNPPPKCLSRAKSKARLDSFDKVACKYYTHTPVRVGPSHIVFPYKKENLEQCNVVPWKMLAGVMVGIAACKSWPSRISTTFVLDHLTSHLIFLTPAFISSSQHLEKCLHKK